MYMGRAVAVGLAILTLAGCKYEGVVQDGYLVGARVCIDLNGNAACDHSEPVTRSRHQGKYSISTLAEGASEAAFIAEVSSKTIDEDTGTQVERPFRMAAPAGYNSVVNPLTTLVYARMQAEGEGAEEAEAAVQAQLGVTDILDYDYIAAADASAHEVAIAVAARLADAEALIADSETRNVNVKAMVAVAEKISIMIEAGNGVADAVVTKGDIYAVSVPYDPENPRNAAADAGEVEVLAGIGYHATMFDSADNKCQHCHNDLYDTWQKSMHAKSWVDPIFQSKYQDFLRLHISKIGAAGPTGEYTEATFKKVAQVCIKCHAPSAFYSGDFNVNLNIISDNPVGDFDEAVLNDQMNTAPAYDPDKVAKVVGVSKTGQIYQASYHIGNKHNREGISCAYCHSMETVRMMNDVDNEDGGMFTLTNPIKMGPIGPVVRAAGETLVYSANAAAPDMNAFFGLIGPEKYADPANTPEAYGEFDNLDGQHPKVHDGRYVIKSIPPGEYTGGPFYGPYGVTAVTNSREDDDLDRASLVKSSFVEAGEAHHFGDYGKGMCLSCHQRSSLMLNPESNRIPGLQVGDDSFLELCTTWTAMSDGVGTNYTDTAESPKCQKCHMEQLANKTVLHKWNDPSSLFTAADGVTAHFDPDLADSLVAMKTLNNHAFMGANMADFGLGKIKSGFSADMNALLSGSAVEVETSLLNKTGHMFPGAHPMRRVLTRVVVTDAAGNRLPYSAATGVSTFETITNSIATLPGEDVLPGHEAVTVAYDASRDLRFQGQQPDLDGTAVTSQQFDNSVVNWASPDGTVANPTPTQQADGSWAMVGTTTVKKITDSPATDNFTRIYGRETGKRASDGTFVVRPGFDSNIVTDNRLSPNERENYSIAFDASTVTAWPVTVTYKVYYMKKGAGGKFPVGDDGFFDSTLPADKKKKLAIFEVYSKSVTVQ